MSPRLSRGKVRRIEKQRPDEKRFQWNSTLPQRSKPLPRSSSPIARSGPPKKRNAKRSKANHERAYGEHAKWIRTLPCCVCGIRGFTVAAHTRTGGMSRKADTRWNVPLCSTRIQMGRDGLGVWVQGCHETSHAGIQTFEREYGVDLKAIAAQLWEQSPANPANQKSVAFPTPQQGANE